MPHEEPSEQLTNTSRPEKQEANPTIPETQGETRSATKGVVDMSTLDLSAHCKRSENGVTTVEKEGEELPAPLRIALKKCDQVAAGIKKNTKLKNDPAELISPISRMKTLLQLIIERSGEISSSKLCSAGPAALQALGKLKKMSDKADNMPEGRRTLLQIPDSIQRTICTLRAIADNISIVTPDDLMEYQIKDNLETLDYQLLTHLRAILSAANEKYHLGKNKNNAAAQAIIGNILETPPSKKTDEEGYLEWTEYLIIRACIVALPQGETFLLNPDMLNSLIQQAERGENDLTPFDAAKLVAIAEKLHELAQTAESEEKSASSPPQKGKVDMVKARRFATGLVARILLTPSLLKEPQSGFEKYFGRYLQYIESAARAMPLITEAAARQTRRFQIQAADGEDFSAEPQLQTDRFNLEEIQKELAGDSERGGFSDLLEDLFSE